MGVRADDGCEERGVVVVAISAECLTTRLFVTVTAVAALVVGGSGGWGSLVVLDRIAPTLEALSLAGLGAALAWIAVRTLRVIRTPSARLGILVSSVEVVGVRTGVVAFGGGRRR